MGPTDGLFTPTAPFSSGIYCDQIHAPKGSADRQLTCMSYLTHFSVQVQILIVYFRSSHLASVNTAPSGALVSMDTI